MGARIIAVFGATCAALLATWLGNEIYAASVFHAEHFYDPFAIWKVWGMPAAVAAAIATFHMTRRSDWLHKRWRFVQLLGFSSQCAGVACLLYVPIQIACLLLFALLGVTEGSSGGFGVAGAVTLFVYMDAIAVAFGILPAIALQMIVLLLARSMASSVGKEIQRAGDQRGEP